MMRKPNAENASLASLQGLFSSQNNATSATAPVEESHQRKGNEGLKGIDFDRLANLIEISRKQIEPANQRELILLVGRTGAGKSTTLNYLMGSRMSVEEVDIDTRLVVAKGEKMYAKIGHNEDSETLHP